MIQDNTQVGMMVNYTQWQSMHCIRKGTFASGIAELHYVTFTHIEIHLPCSRPC